MIFASEEGVWQFCSTRAGAFYSDAKKPGYSGVAILCKNKPKAISQSFNHPLIDDEGRLIIAL